jgi:bacterioferritin-associated ferredoxin
MSVFGRTGGIGICGEVHVEDASCSRVEDDFIGTSLCVGDTGASRVTYDEGLAGAESLRVGDACASCVEDNLAWVVFCCIGCNEVVDKTVRRTASSGVEDEAWGSLIVCRVSPERSYLCS